ncbi:unnamed protein product [Schistosoma curassoni]|uniref:RT_RNaseH_2 domain-containing protein n=1 Tax=Schistosoma curassoni TaxID=6186 RepID=A0A183KUU9_9TREM|nr:unnamed protein product [Schistosoma curassoni]
MIYSPRQSRQLNHITQFTSDAQQIPGANNVVADALARITALKMFYDMSLSKFIQIRKGDADLQNDSSFAALKLRVKQMGRAKKHLLCDTSAG